MIRRWLREYGALFAVVVALSSTAGYLVARAVNHLEVIVVCPPSYMCKVAP